MLAMSFGEELLDIEFSAQACIQLVDADLDFCSQSRQGGDPVQNLQPIMSWAASGSSDALAIASSRVLVMAGLYQSPEAAQVGIGATLLTPPAGKGTRRR
jgi:hypothetical protein